MNGQSAIAGSVLLASAKPAKSSGSLLADAAPAPDIPFCDHLSPLTGRGLPVAQTATTPSGKGDAHTETPLFSEAQQELEPLLVHSGDTEPEVFLIDPELGEEVTGTLSSSVSESPNPEVEFKTSGFLTPLMPGRTATMNDTEVSEGVRGTTLEPELATKPTPEVPPLTVEVQVPVADDTSESDQSSGMVLPLGGAAGPVPEGPVGREVQLKVATPAPPKTDMAQAAPLLVDEPDGDGVLTQLTKLSPGKATSSGESGGTVTLDKPSVGASQTPVPLSAVEPPRIERPRVPAERSFVVQTDVRVPVGQPQWSQAVGDRVLWLAAQNITSAELRLDPPDLGPLHVRVLVQQEQVSVTFTSPHLGVREALDLGSARLREMFDEQGIDLVNVDISDQSLARESEADERQGRSRTSGGEDVDPDESESAATIPSNLVDHYV